jgi:Rieske Fe-S protein
MFGYYINQKMNRREFIERACLSGLGIVAGTTVLSAFNIPTLKASLRPNMFGAQREIPLLLADTPELQTVGGAYHLSIEEIDKDILVVRTGDDDFTAVDIKCTHKGCEVKYEDKSHMFVCPCHDSHFDLDGEAKSGPAKKPLKKYRTSFKDGEITIHVHLDDEPEEKIITDTTRVVKKDSVATDTTKRK